MDSVPAGLRPLGIAVHFISERRFAATANSGDSSVSVFEFLRDPQTRIVRLSRLATIQGIPSPYTLAFCQSALPGLKALVTSPTDNSVSVIQVPEGTVLGRIKVGPQPHAVACTPASGPISRMGLVSNVGDNSLSVIDVDNLRVAATVPDVPGSRAFHGIGAVTTLTNRRIAAVSGTEADGVTLVDLILFRVLTRVPFPRPTYVSEGSSSSVDVASASEGSITLLNVETLEKRPILAGLLNPQDLVGTRLGTFATVGGGNAVARRTSDGTITIIPGIPGAASVDWNLGSLAGDTAVAVTSPDSNSVFLIQSAVRLPSNVGMSNGASFTEGVAPGSLASGFAVTGLTQNFSASSLPLPTTLGGLRLRVGGSFDFVDFQWVYSSTGSTIVPLLFAGPNQVNFQVPPDVALGEAVPIQLEKTDGSTLLGAKPVRSTAPGIFTLLQNGSGQAAALNQDNTINGNPQSIVAAKPATRGTVIQIFATGAGATNPTVAAGVAAPASPLAFTVVQPTVTIGGKSAVVQFSGLAPGFVGLWQINAVIPADVTPGNAVALTVSAGGQTSNSVTIAVQ